MIDGGQRKYPITLSPLEQLFASSEHPTNPEEDAGPEVASLDLENICALRTRSMRKFARALESIASRYEGNGDEESDDVVDLERLQVIEDRGYILQRLSQHTNSSSPSSHKGNDCADRRLEIFELLNPLRDHDPDEWVDHLGEDECLIGSEQNDSTDEDDASNDSDSTLCIHSSSRSRSRSSSLSSSSSSPSCSSCSSSSSCSCSSSSCQKIRTGECSMKRNKLDILAPTSDSTTTQSCPESLPERAYPLVSHDMVTNALFERLKKRVQDRSSDITQHKLLKASMSRKLGRPREEVCGFSSPNSSLITSTSLSSALTSTEPFISPYMQRLLHPDFSRARRSIPGCRSTRPTLLSVPVTPSTLRRETLVDTSYALDEAPHTRSVPRKRTRSPCRSSPSPPAPHQPQLSPRTATRSIRPALLFRTPPVIHSSPVAGRTAKKLKSLQPSCSPRIKQPTNCSQLSEKRETESFSRESSEDPLMLPASSKKSQVQAKPKSQFLASKPQVEE